MSTTSMPTNLHAAPEDLADLQQCLPIELQTPTTVFTRIAAGMSEAGVYRVSAADRQFVLKITAPDEGADSWRSKVQVQQSAADAGIAPKVFHIDENRRAVLSELIVDRSFPAQLGNPATRLAAIESLGRMLRSLHALPIPQGTKPADAMGFLNTIWNAVAQDFVLPAFVREAVERLRVELPPASAGALVMSHNDVNPTNLVFDGERVMLLDWQTTAPNNAYYDLATIAMFFRLDDETSCKLIAAHNDAPVDAVPDVFRYFRRFAPVMSGAAALHMARLRGHPGGEVAAELTPSLGEVYQQLRSGAFDIGSVDGQWTFGLALVKEGIFS